MCVLRIAGRRRRATEPSLDKRSRMAAAPSEGTEITDESLTEAHEEGRGKQTRSRQVRPGGHTAVPPGGRLPGSGADIPEGQSAASGAAKAEHVRDRLLGHWGTCPGINLIYAHLNRLILDTGAERRKGDRLLFALMPAPPWGGKTGTGAGALGSDQACFRYCAGRRCTRPGVISSPRSAWPGPRGARRTRPGRGRRKSPGPRRPRAVDAAWPWQRSSVPPGPATARG